MEAKHEERNYRIRISLLGSFSITRTSAGYVNDMYRLVECTVENSKSNGLIDRYELEQQAARSRGNHAVYLTLRVEGTDASKLGVFERMMQIQFNAQTVRPGSRR
ncbi:MAG TPA: hypothetical protein VJJ76_01160 [archaeon]|nr:hypothetical protein [archaeon]